ncbi:hypothetical protein JAK58_08575 [Stenotrophomonas maltophilia]|nr:hypothetical protein [Stenotrophomonas maltophilia]MCU1091570.1 hypothetical protein [Stenotrophomonas maltophilia]
MVKINTGVWRGLQPVLLLGLLLSVAACTGKPNSSQNPAAGVPPTGAATKTKEVPASTARSARYAGVRMLLPHSGCAYEYSPVDFCDAQHRAQIDQAILTQVPNFNRHYILAQLDERKEYFQRSIVLIDSRDGTVYPLPIDAFSGPLVGKEGARTYGTVETSAESDTFCVNGALLVYRAFEEGRFCFGFDGVRFTGHTTQYMQ